MESVSPALRSLGPAPAVDAPPPPTGPGPVSASATADAPAVRVELSTEALLALAEERAREEELIDLQRRLPAAREAAEEERRAREEHEALLTGLELTEEEQEAVDTLKAWDREIRAHELAHVAAAGGHAGTPTYDLVTGPDGRQYAVGGSVKVDLSDAGSPEANAAKMRRIKAAATAVSDPSAADLRVAGKAERRLQQALRQRASRAYLGQADPAPGR